MFRTKGIRTITSVMLALTIITLHIIPGYAAKFSDLSGYWAEDSITRLAALQIVKGYNGKFNPGGGVTRAEFAVMMVRALGLVDQAEVLKGASAGFKDLPSTHWASGFIIVAKENGIISGYPDDTFKPSALITRAEITSVLVRALNLSRVGDSDSIPEVFKDWQEIPVWAADAVISAHNYKLIKGFPDGSFYPEKNATRGETAVLIERVLERLGSEYSFYGIVQSINKTSNLITIDISGQIESFSYKSGIRVKLSKGYGILSDIKPGQGIYIILDDNGYVVYIEAAEDAGLEGVISEASVEVKAQNYIKPQNYINAQSSIKSLTKSYNDKKMTGNEVIPVILVTREGMAMEVAAIIRAHGGSVTHVNSELDFLFARINSSLLENLRFNSLIEEITRDDKVKIEILSTSEDEDALINTESNAASSLNATKQAINAPEFVKVTRSDGKNQIVAVIDTGIDPGHPDLQKTSANKHKIVDWRDFTGEGDIHTSYSAHPQNNFVNLADTHYNAAGITSVSGSMKYGYLREVDFTDIDGKNGYDLNFNGSEHDVFAVIVTDSKQSGVYDTVYIDTDDDKDFSNEKPLHQYSKTFEYNSFTGPEGSDRLNFVLAQVESDGSKINIGFDGNDHGTHVAGIVAANGSIKGVAPGAQLMSLKVLDAEGYGSLSTITEAISYAASNGAKIINLSLGISLSDDNDDDAGIPSKLLNKLTEKYGVIFVVAAGNDGPGLNTLNTPGGALAALTVGAFNTPEMWKTDYGWTVPSENLWFFSSIGPGKDGSVAPSIVAPGSAVSTVPLRGGKQYFLSEGTSIAAPHVAGAVALLLEVVNRNNLKVSPVTLKRAIELGARPITGYSTAEQGYGALNLPISWAELLSLQESSHIKSRTDNPGTGEGVGFVFREGLPGRVTLYLRNASNALKRLVISENRFSKPSQNQVFIPSQLTRAVEIDVSVPEKKGLFSWFITGDDPDTYGKDLEVLTTVVNPYLLTESNNYNVIIKDEAESAQYKRYFFKVPPGVESLTAKLTVTGERGRAKIFLFEPSGKLAGDSQGFAGVNYGPGSDTVTVSSKSPDAGVWECIVYSSAGLSSFDLTNTEFSLGVTLSGAGSAEPEQTSRKVIVGLVPKTILSGVRDYITVQIRDRFTKKPFEGFIEINGKLFYSRRGKVTLPVEVSQNSLTLIVKTLPESPLNKPWEFDFTLNTGK